MMNGKLRRVGTATAALMLTTAGLVWTSGDASAYGQCTRSDSSDRSTISVTCGPQPNGYQFRVQAYICTGMPTLYCDTEPVYGNWAPWWGTSSVYVGPENINYTRISLEVGQA